MYLSSIQQGIQAAHAVSDMFVKYMPVEGDTFNSKMEILSDWATNHKTIILLNAGYAKNINNLRQLFSDDRNPYPWEIFYEEMDALWGSPTSIGIVLPRKIYETAALFRKRIVSTDESPSPRVLIKNFGTMKVSPDNDWGIETDVPLVWEYSDWEVQLCEKLNTFGLAQ